MTSATPATGTSSLTTGGRYALVACAWLFSIAGVVQVFLAGLSVFDSTSYWSDHADFGNMIGILALLLPILALVGRVGWRLGGLSLALLGLYVLQMVLANLDNGPIAAFHAVNALILIGASSQLGTQTLDLARSRA